MMFSYPNHGNKSSGEKSVRSIPVLCLFLLVALISSCNVGGGLMSTPSWGGAKTFFGSEGLIILEVSAAGKLIVSSLAPFTR